MGEDAFFPGRGCHFPLGGNAFRRAESGVPTAANYVFDTTRDIGGITGNGPIPTVLDGDLLKFRAADQTWHPITGATQDVAVGGLTLHFLNGVFTGAS